MSKTKSRPSAPTVTAAPIYDEVVKALGHDPLEGWVRPPDPADIPVTEGITRGGTRGGPFPSQVVTLAILPPARAKQVPGAKSAPAT